jgi:hypothetical protein
MRAEEYYFLSMKRIVIILAVLCVLVLGITGFFWYKLLTHSSAVHAPTEPASFAECVARGYPVAESFPETCRTPSGVIFENPATEPVVSVDPAACDPIVITSIIPGGVLSSGMVVTGTARGFWFFEASMPLELLDGNGSVVTSSIVQADGDWMTESCVPFTTPLVFDMPGTQTGILRFHKDNPSGEPQNDASYDVPVQFWQQVL